jgi:hypothetical protein
VRLEGLGQLKNPMTSRIEPATLKRNSALKSDLLKVNFLWRYLILEDVVLMFALTAEQRDTNLASFAL